MLGLNIFRLIGDLFGMLFKPFEWIRLTLAKGDAGWWTSNAINWVFLLILILLLNIAEESAKILKNNHFL